MSLAVDRHLCVSPLGPSSVEDAALDDELSRLAGP
jgi:hypothetical protein